MIEYVPWSLSFEDSGRRGWGAVRPTPLQWEAVNFRGPDNDTADVEITGFGHRKIGFAEGPLVHSPAQLSTLMGVQMPSEDDVLHADKLPSFGGALSREESEALMGFLTVDYLRVPLVLGFFATGDRLTYLFNPELQRLLRAAIFEAGAWSPPLKPVTVTHVPIRQTATQQRDAVQQRALNAAIIPVEQQVLGTATGLLLNELRFSPGASLDPLVKMLTLCGPLLVVETKAAGVESGSGPSAYSTEAPFLILMIGLTLDVLS